MLFRSIGRITDAPNVSEVLRVLSQESEYEFSSSKGIKDYESVLMSGLKNMYGLLYKISAHREIVDIPACKYDFHNLKVALKSKYIHNDADYLYLNITTLDPARIKDFVKSGAENDEFPAYITAAAGDAQNKFDESGEPQDIDVILDRHMFAYMLSVCEKVQNDFITEYVRLSIDFYNIKTLLRVKNMQKGSRFLNESLVSGGLTHTDFFLRNYDKSPEMLTSVFHYKYFGDVIKNGMESYSKEGNYSGLEKLFDNCLISHIKKAKYVAFGAEVLFAYIISKENEMRQIRILVTCKNNNIPVEILKERLRDNYA